MGMDVCGKGNKDAYFRNNVWWWRPLADYCVKVAPEITKECVYWHSNDGDGLNGPDSLKLADILEKECDSGRTADYMLVHETERRNQPPVKCRICEGTGKRVPAPDTGAGWIECNGCNGEGTKQSMDTWYPFSVENVREFIDFLRDADGFEIW